MVINDGSSDDGATRDIALSYGDKIRYFEKENGGVSSALNFGIREMHGEYFSWLSHDDKYSPNKIQHQVELLLGNRHCVALCAIRMINKDSQYISETYQLHNLQKGSRIHWSNALCRLFEEDCFGGCCFLIPREIFEECGLFDESLRYVQDFLMWSSFFLNRWDVIYDTTSDVYGRVHMEQLTQRRQDLFHEESLTIAQELIPRLKEADSPERQFLYRYALYNAKYNNNEIVEWILTKNKAFMFATRIQLLKLYFVRVYGRVRPFVRKLYHKFFRKA